MSAEISPARKTPHPQSSTRGPAKIKFPMSKFPISARQACDRADGELEFRAGDAVGDQPVLRAVEIRAVRADGCRAPFTRPRR
jgi:hypothetical protein